MRHRIGLRTGLSALLLLGMWGGTSLAPAVASTPNPPVSPGLLTALQRDLGLTEQQARERLAQERAATALQDKARRAAGSAYGGSWFDADSGRLTVAVTGDRNAEAVRATGAATRLVEHTAEELDAVKVRIDRQAGAKGAPRGVSSWRVDPQTNQVVVDVVASLKNDSAVRAFVDRARRTGSVRIRATMTEPPATFSAGTVGGDPYYTGNVRCSIGFSVHGGFVTAGHCGRPGNFVRGWDGSGMGTFQGSSFPGDDYAYVSVGHGWWTVPVVLGWGTVPDQLVRGSAEAPVGASICRSGSTTHWHCGTLLAKNESVNYQQGSVHQMTKTSVCAEPGDSGGSFISGDQAQGVTSGGWGNCSGGGQTWYQPVNEILWRYGLTLHTT
ncbi:S1 family peptidase [Streptomyces lunaelactis]|uniref:S1 family peptidase n=1 Tax=Streptomyces lunaelactis TaxID=1535768 RepID=UPI0015D17318|nr:S1 family peptidase [Streptomyces lunaelactis]